MDACGPSRTPDGSNPALQAAFLQVTALRAARVGCRDLAQALLNQGFGPSVILELLLGLEVDPRRKLESAVALVDGILPLPVVSWALEAHGVHPASLAFAQEPAQIRDYLQRMHLSESFRNWQISASDKHSGWPMDPMEVVPGSNQAVFPKGLVLPDWKMHICCNPCVRDLGLKMVVSALVVQGCPALRSVGLEEPGGDGSYGLDECPAVLLEKCPSLESLKYLGPLRRLYLVECGGASIHAEPIVARGLYIRDCPLLEVLPEVASVPNEMVLLRLPRLRTMPKSLHLGGDLQILSCHRLERLPEDLEVAGDLILEDLPTLAGLPKNLKVGGTIRVSGCPRPRNGGPWSQASQE
jgi:hypothetical protein